MSNVAQLAEQHIREHESRLRHIDELLERARKVVAEQTEHTDTRAKLSTIAQERDKLANRLDNLRLRSLDDWRKEELEKAGPMAAWDAVAIQLERLVEAVER